MHEHVSDVGLLLVDVFSDFQFPGGDYLAKHAVVAAAHLHDLLARARRANVPCIYVNDDGGAYRASFDQRMRQVMSAHAVARRVAELLAPAAQDYRLLKPKHSAFYQTSLSSLLAQLKLSQLVIAGFATDICVVFSVTDAYLRDFEVTVPSDGTAACAGDKHRVALAYMRTCLRTKTPPSAAIRFVKRRGRTRLRLTGT